MRRCLQLIGLCLSTAALTGCGTQEYEQRLEKTRTLFARMEYLDANLQRAWVDDTGVQLRLPLQFSILTGVSMGAGADADANVPDPRQPAFLTERNFQLPGLRAAFFAPMHYRGADGAAGGDDFGYIYVLTNHSQGAATASFSKDLVKNLSRTLNTGINPSEWPKKREFPSQIGALAQVVPYEFVEFVPNEALAGIERRFSVFMHEAGSVQVVVLFVFPKDFDDVDRLDAIRIPLCLETLRVGSAAPSGGNSAGAVGNTGGGQSRGQPASF